MFTRTMTCTLKLEKKPEFLEGARALAEQYRGQPGFVDLLTFVSDEHPDRAFVMAVWQTRSDADAFYRTRAPLLDLKPFVSELQIEHHFLESAMGFKTASGKAA